MEYKLPDLPSPNRAEITFGAHQGWIDYYSANEMRQYAEQAVTPLLAEIERLKRGEFICNKCYLRKDAEVGTPDF